MSAGETRNLPLRARLTRVAVIVLVAALASYAAAAVDGEASYDLTFTEMFVISCCALAPAAVYLGRAWIRKR